MFSIWLIFTTIVITWLHMLLLYCQFDSYLLPITCIHVLHVLFSIWLICTTHYLHTFSHVHVLLSIWLIFTTHYLYTRVTCIALNLTHMYYPLPAYTFYMYCSQFDSYLLPITCMTRITCIVLNLTHMYYPLPAWHICTCIVINLTHIYYP